MRRISPMKIIFGMLTAFVLLMLYFPFIIMVILSFQGPRGGPTFPLRGVSTVWYYKLFHPGVVTQWSDVGEYLGNYWEAFGASFVLAFLVAIASSILGLLAAQGFRRRFRGSTAIFYLFILGIITPGIIVSLGAGLLIDQLGIGRAWNRTGFLIHVMWTLPFCFIISLVLFNRFNRRLEEAGLTLGANPVSVFLKITFPLMQLAVLSDLLFGFTLSWDEYQRSLLVMGVQQTLPLILFATMMIRVTPMVYALGTIVTLVSFVVVGVYLFLTARALRKRAREAIIVREVYMEAATAERSTPEKPS